ncbi:serine/threonine-protein kinase PLK1 [Hyalella azteca]|uniref:Serine/threonine-protein kinase PLK n=1 Tax=Hyalella azteca TaxID=294128 RepID=A0A8B7NYK4_HYAAZ|nr:serine/threonine-protein kinase PLK1 [Hyalella azteca]
MIKTSKIVGWSPHHLSQQNQVHRDLNNQHKVHHHDHNHPHEWMTSYSSTAAIASTAIITATANTTPKEPATNTSLDSGVAGLRDTPVHTPGPLVNNNNMPGPKTNSPSDNEDHNVPKFIVDHSTRTTFMKGRFLGKGGFARVHELTDLTTNVAYAGKIIPKSRITKPHHKEKIAREIEVHRQLQHKHVVRFHRYFEDDSNVYIILENCSMRSLVHVLKYRRTLTEPEVRFFIHQLAEGVAYIHGEGIIHRDLKLGNMFLSQDMNVKIGDFGLATRTADNRQVTICGTPNYIAPEVLNKCGHFYQADIWAIGCIMYALLVGQPPFETDTLKETYSRITNNQYVIPPLVSSHGRSLITALLHPDPKSRPSVPELLRHDFFTKGLFPRSLPTLACTQVPQFTVDSLVPRVSEPTDLHHQQQQLHSQVISQDIKKITTSVSTLRLPNVKPPQDKISILTDNLGHQIPEMNHRNEILNEGISSPPSPPSLHPQQRYISTLPNQVNQRPSHQMASPTTISHLSKDVRRKDSNGGNNGNRLFEKLTSVIYATDGKNTNCLGSLVTGRKREVTSGTLYNLLASCLDSMPDGVTGNLIHQSHTPLFISKWIDYSNKYGFGYQLSDNSVGVFFNDLTRINISGDKCRVEYHDCSGRLTAVAASACPAWLQERYQLLRYFATYMDENLTGAGDKTPPPHTPNRSSSSNSSANSSTSSTSSTGSGGSGTTGGACKNASSQVIPHIRRWDRTPKSIIMQLSNGTFQINFFKDHTKIVVSGERCDEDACLLYINADRQSCAYRLADIASAGCDAAIRERLVYALSCLRQYAELDGEEV